MKYPMVFCVLLFMTAFASGCISSGTIDEIPERLYCEKDADCRLVNVGNCGPFEVVNIQYVDTVDSQPMVCFVEVDLKAVCLHNRCSIQ